jgi:hypothetical protein
LRRARNFRNALHPADRPHLLPANDEQADALVARAMIISDCNVFTIYPSAALAAALSASAGSGGSGGGGGSGGSGEDDDDSDCDAGPQPPQPMGCGLYLLGDMVNHSCVANCQWGHDGSAIEITALQAIRPGDEVNIAYIPGTLPRAERLGKLRKSYRFACACVGCSGDGEGPGGQKTTAVVHLM